MNAEEKTRPKPGPFRGQSAKTPPAETVEKKEKKPFVLRPHLTSKTLSGHEGLLKLKEELSAKTIKKPIRRNKRTEKK